MSASLVGSEMCIRDSLRRWPTPWVKTMTALNSSQASAGGRNSAHERPVSYTHLTLPTICSV
eukprot:7431709-Alexandrium_andersonii.AAC.1